MKAAKGFALVVMLLPTLVLAQNKSKKQPNVPAVFDHARYVYVESMDGNEFRPGLYPADRQAIADVEAALRDWGRYTLTTKREEADLVFVVRKRRLVTGNLGGSVGVGSGSQSSQALGRNPHSGGEIEAGGEAGPPDDLFQVCTLDPGGNLSVPIWYRTLEDGLDRPQLALFQQFNTAVEKAYPGAQAGQASKP